MTELLYLCDAEVRAFDATVASAGDDRVVLDRTAFYVTGGGQPHDSGTLSWEGGSAQVVDVRRADGAVVHVLEGDVPPAGTAVHGPSGSSSCPVPPRSRTRTSSAPRST